MQRKRNEESRATNLRTFKTKKYNPQAFVN